MSEKKAEMTIQMIKKGTEDSQEPWVEMFTVEDIFKHACTLSEEDRKKMFQEFKQMNEMLIAVKELAELESGGEKVDLGVGVFRWRND